MTDSLDTTSTRDGSIFPTVSTEIDAEITSHRLNYHEADIVHAAIERVLNWKEKLPHKLVSQAEQLSETDIFQAHLDPEILNLLTLFVDTFHDVLPGELEQLDKMTVDPNGPLGTYEDSTIVDEKIYKGPSKYDDKFTGDGFLL
jgi:hypothetical protein